MLNISVAQNSEACDPRKNYSKRECSYGNWVCSFTLPETANPETAYTDGVLKIVITKREEAK